jgi:hypothetical protein
MREAGPGQITGPVLFDGFHPGIALMKALFLLALSGMGRLIGFGAAAERQSRSRMT